MMHLISFKVACYRRKIGDSQELIFPGPFLHWIHTMQMWLAIGSLLCCINRASELVLWFGVLYEPRQNKNSKKIILHYISIYRLGVFF